MSGLVSMIFGDNSAKKAAAQQIGLAKSDQGQQMKIMSENQAKADMEAADLSRPGLGRRMMAYSSSRAQTLGGA